jgi:thioredoxin 1
VFELVSMKVVLGVLAGAAVGIAYSRLNRCATGTCPLTSRWWSAGLYGAFLGLVMTSFSFAGPQTQPSGQTRMPRANSTAPATAPASQEGENNMPRHIESEADFATHVLHANKPVLVDFYATWCGPCKMVAPIMEQIATELAGRAEVVQVDVDKVSDLATRYRIMGVPTVMLFDQGKVVKAFVGVRTKSEYLDAVRQAVAH